MSMSPWLILPTHMPLVSIVETQESEEETTNHSGRHEHPKHRMLKKQMGFAMLERKGHRKHGLLER